MIKVHTHDWGLQTYNAEEYNIDLDSGLLSVYKDSGEQSRNRAVARFRSGVWAFVERKDD